MFDIAIIGAGPAGASAALFTAKAGKKTILFDHDKGLTKRAWIENHYGVSEISGPDLIEVGQKQATKFGAQLQLEEVTNITKTNDHFKIKTTSAEYEAKEIILATGITTKLSESLGLQEIPGTEPRIPKIFAVDQDGKTDVDGVWVAGTAAGVSVHSIITAGDGAKVAINVISKLNGERYVDHDLLK